MASTGGDSSLVSGLVNFGNTCFFNSVLQALAAVPYFHEYVRGIIIAHGKAVKLMSLVNGDRDEKETLYDAKKRDADVGGVSARILALLRVLSRPYGSWDHRETIMPSVALGEFSAMFEDSGQHDAQVNLRSWC